MNVRVLNPSRGPGNLEYLYTEKRKVEKKELFHRLFDLSLLFFLFLADNTSVSWAFERPVRNLFQHAKRCWERS